MFRTPDGPWDLHNSPDGTMSSKPVSAPRCRLAAGRWKAAAHHVHTTCTPRAHHVHTTCALEKILEVLEALSF